MDKNVDAMGMAILDYAKWQREEKSGKGGRKLGRLCVYSPMFEDDEIPLKTLFRSYNSMPKIEQLALDLAKGKVLDVGAGAGCHSLALQQRGLDVTAVEISPLSVEAMLLQGVKNVVNQDFFTLEGRYDTILMLMNGIGIVGTLERMPSFFTHLDNVLAPGGQLLCDSSDIGYLFEDTPELIEEMDYYGEQTFQMQYENVIGETFPWLYIDSKTLKQVAEENGYVAEIVAEGDHYDYLARITKKCLRSCEHKKNFINKV